MALPSTLKRKGGLFGSSPMRGPFDTPGIGDGMAAAQAPTAPAKPKFFGEGGVGRGIAGNIGDFLLQYSGMDPIYQPAMQQKQAMAYDQQQRQATRRERLEDWQAQEEYKRANPAPINNDTVNDFNWYKGLSPEDQRIYDAMHPIVVDVTDAAGRVTKQMVPRAQLIGGTGPRPAIGAVVADPRKQGGQAAPPPATFR